MNHCRVDTGKRSEGFKLGKVSIKKLDRLVELGLEFIKPCFTGDQVDSAGRQLLTICL